jgi:predicted nucleic acid-binding protein
MYLLDTQQVMDLFSRDGTRPVFEWIGSAKPGRADLFVSVISLGQIAHAIEGMPPADRNQWRRLYHAGRRDLEEIGSIIDVDYGIVEVWQGSLRGGLLMDIEGADEEFGEDDRLIFATAIARGYALVTRGSPQLQEIAARTTLTVIEL